MAEVAVPVKSSTWLVIFASAALVFLSSGGSLFSQEPPPPDASQQPPPPPIQPAQLDDLVAPIALYPDSLLGQILAASTYPLELVEAGEWLQQNQNLKGKKLVDEARKQNWDPSVAALVAFPDVIQRLTQDVRWTTDLGNAFLAQQADVMAAVQRMRGCAEANGKLMSNQQLTVATINQDGQSAISIQPADPQVVYVPYYDPAWVWGPPIYGYYPPLLYPGVGLGFSFWPGVSLGLYFGGCCGWGGWGWGPNWFGGTVIVNNNFFHRYGYREFGERGFQGSEAWAHNPAHRIGVPYGNAAVASRFNAGPRPEPRGGFSQPNAGGVTRNGEFNSRPAPRQFGTPQFEQRAPRGNQSVFGGVQPRGGTQFEGDHGFHSMGGGFGGGGGFHGGGGGAPHGGGGGRR